MRHAPLHSKGQAVAPGWLRGSLGASMNCAVSTMLKYPACPSPVPACLPLQVRPGGATPAATSLCPCPACATSRTRPPPAALRMSSGGAPLLGWGRGLPLHLGTCGYSALRLLQPLCLYCVVFPAASPFAAIRAHHTPALSPQPTTPLLQPHHRRLRGQHRRLDPDAPLQQGHRPAGGCDERGWLGCAALYCTSTCTAL